MSRRRVISHLHYGKSICGWVSLSKKKQAAEKADNGVVSRNEGSTLDTYLWKEK